MTPYQFTVWKRKVAKEKRLMEQRLSEMRSFLSKAWVKVGAEWDRQNS